MKKFSLLRIGLVNGHLKRLKGGPLSVFIYLLSICDRWGIAKASHREIDMKTGYSFITTWEALKTLEQPNLEGLPYIIPLRKKSEGMRQEYWLPKYDLKFLNWLIAGSIRKKEGNLIKKIDKVMLTSLIESYQNSLQKVNKVEVQEVKKEEIKKPQKKRGARTLEYSSGFENFWANYPRKIIKRKALRNWLTRLREGRTEEDMIKASKNYRDKVEREGVEEKHILHPSTFLGPDLPFEDYIEVKGNTEAEFPKLKMNKEGRAYYVEEGG